jgi:hypothetical protein
MLQTVTEVLQIVINGTANDQRQCCNQLVAVLQEESDGAASRSWDAASGAPANS